MPASHEQATRKPLVSGTGRPGRTPATTHGELSKVALNLFLERGFEATTIDDIVLEAGIGRRTFFRYFSSKNELPWGEFDDLLESMRKRFAEMDPALHLMDAIRTAVLEFNSFPETEQQYHRGRMWLVLNVPALHAYSTLKYTDWRLVIAEFVAHRLELKPTDLTPQTISWASLGMCIGAYQRWLEADETSDLLDLIDASFRTAETVFSVKQ